jgi:cytochrome P450
LRCSLGVNVRNDIDGLQPRIFNILTYINNPLRVPIKYPQIFNQLYAKIDNTYYNFRKDIEYVYNWISNVIKKMKKNPMNNEFTKSVLGTSDEESQKQLLLSMMFGNLETTSRLLTAMIYLLLKHPKYIDIIRNETNKYDIITYDDIMSQKFPQTKNIFDETARLYPPVWILSRSANENIQIANHEIKKDSILLFSPLCMQRDKNFFDEEFYPERFDEMNREKKKLLYPFLVGNGMCPADKYVEVMSIMFISCILKKYDFKLFDPNIILEPISVGTLRAFNELYLLVNERVF